MHGPVQGCVVNPGTGQPPKGPTARKGHPGCEEELTAQTPRAPCLSICQGTPAQANPSFNLLTVILNEKGSGNFFKTP